MGGSRQTNILIIGAGFAGIGMAMALRRAGRTDFRVLEQASDIGGTWRDNQYPGCACDIPSHLYSFSFAQNPDWTRTYPGQPEIWAYLRRLVDEHRLRAHIAFGAHVTGARWDELAQHWRVRCADGTEHTARSVVAGIGALHIPHVPRLPGIDRFTGRAFHSARWDHDYDLRGKRVAVIGTGASAVQFVPEIAGDVAELHLFQRTPPWLMPKADRPVSPGLRRLFQTVPAAQTVYRDLLYWALEARGLGFTLDPRIMRLGERIALRHLADQVPDPALRAALTPDYTMGCKRVLISDDYYPALTRPHVHLVTTGVAEVRERSIVDGSGVERPVDAIIYGTGFHVVDSFDYLDVIGRDGLDLAATWRRHGLETYYGITVAGFPNWFFLLGPNTGLGHNSVVFMIEAQIHYVLRCLDLLDRGGVGALDVRPDAQRAFTERLQRRLRRGVWSRGGCTSWYLDAKGVNRTIWPGSTWRYWLATRWPRRGDYELTPRWGRAADAPDARWPDPLAAR
ncbi:flavin-containing monooxygenase [Goodfellowiella coeruleoviolacea]|uniref:Flavoprotein CzcO associated with the cation diffusion facilitator CzcD n=1 Tax=Goodfellowiella coeruleoviolacea TaxID=334858 RepID=A0AAE3GCL8_9PSEU|nr:NAD(P)/FAD-dependent oxidoreductase [Goodfellowiella coeruleoviolacea]MCP2164940.1 putative flavoprotein CzcO associated with the cation diffusion facilitator CzcD [Goodfellowiella coeruleoviolacea]